jgi:hypothetical protein
MKEPPARPSPRRPPDRHRHPRRLALETPPDRPAPPGERPIAPVAAATPRHARPPGACPQPVNSFVVCSFCSATFCVLWCLLCRLSLCSFFFVPCCVVLPGTSSLRVFLLLFCIRCRFCFCPNSAVLPVLCSLLCARHSVFLFHTVLSIARLDMAENWPHNKF